MSEEFVYKITIKTRAPVLNEDGPKIMQKLFEALGTRFLEIDIEAVHEDK